MPNLLFAKDFELFPPFVWRKVIPILGLAALVLGITLTIYNGRGRELSQSNEQIIASANRTPSDPEMSNATTSVASNASSNRSNSPPALELPGNVNSGPPSDATLGQTQAEVSTSPTATPDTIRYETGTNLIPPQNTGGRSSFTISNGTALDAIAKLVDTSTGKSSRLVYIQAGSVGNISNISAGFYELKFSLGAGYEKESGKFLNSQSFAKFDNTFDCTVIREGREVRWTDHRVTLNPVLNGNAKTSTISADEFENN